MLKRTGWVRRFKAREPEEVCAAPPAPCRPHPATARAVMARVDESARPVPKPEVHRNRHLLDMAQGKPCLFRWMDNCERTGGTTTVAAHENSHEAGKAGARKANDERSAWACAACHTAYDQGPATAMVKKQVFMIAMDRQIKAWQRIAADKNEKPADRRASRWALEQWGIAS
ncbi:nuclease domain-containing protein [Hydrogenophaga defluvii]|uniref:Nuclease domain-containing protein n=1 Tax=Hydrogenophaga defluvii TaxID=249410 RepID=A0ABW2SBC7_9BURK